MIATEEQYQRLLPYKDVARMAKEHDTYVGGDIAPLLTALEQDYGHKIDRHCPGCVMGFLKFTYSLIIQYENGCTKRE